MLYFRNTCRTPLQCARLESERLSVDLKLGRLFARMAWDRANMRCSMPLPWQEQLKKHAGLNPGRQCILLLLTSDAGIIPGRLSHFCCYLQVLRELFRAKLHTSRNTADTDLGQTYLVSWVW